jgi:DNA anti-recombination protein RmuC
METTIITNVVLMTVLGLGFLSYLVWLGFKLNKLSELRREEVYEINTKIDNLHRQMGNNIDELNRKLQNSLDEIYRDIDKVDSRFDRKLSDLDEDFSRRIEDIYTQNDKSVNEIYSTISTLDEGIDKLTK